MSSLPICYSYHPLQVQAKMSAKWTFHFMLIISLKSNLASFWKHMNDQQEFCKAQSFFPIFSHSDSLKISFPFLFPMRGNNPDFNLANVPVKQNWVISVYVDGLLLIHHNQNEAEKPRFFPGWNKELTKGNRINKLLSCQKYTYALGDATWLMWLMFNSN